MAFKLIAFTAFVAAVNAGLIASGYSTPLAVAKTVVAEEYDAHPQYNYGYEVQDSLTGDSKSQHEVRDGDVVQGSYSLIDADGTKRTVEYTADPVHGFNAVVHKEPLGVKAVTPVVTKVAAPLGLSAPLSFAAPVAKVAYSSPVAHYYH